MIQVHILSYTVVPDQKSGIYRESWLQIMKQKHVPARYTQSKQKKRNIFSSESALLCRTLLCVLFFVWQEVVFHIFTFRSVGQFIVYPILFALPAGFLLLALTSAFPRKANQIILWISMSFFTFVYMAETVFEHVFKIPLLFSDIHSGNTQVVAYYREILMAILNCLPALLLMLLPLVAFGITLRFGMKLTKKKPIFSLLVLILSAICAGTSLLAIHFSDRKNNSIYDNYHNMFDATAAMEHYGVLTTLRLNAQNLLFPDEIDPDDIVISGPANLDPSTSTPSTSSPSVSGNPSSNPSSGNIPPAPTVDTSYQMLDIDFVSLANSESNAAVKKLHQYFASLVPTRKNEYTGMFEGYNLIHITAEAFWPYCISEELTPTLYKLLNTGFVFNNFYVPPTGESTCGGEFMNMSGLLPNPHRPSGTYTYYQTADNYMPYALGNVFRRLGVSTCYAYHNNSLTYYKRHITIPNMGYVFKSSNPGSLSASQANGLLFKVEHPKSWPQSDLEMINATADEYITADKQFHAYYMTVSGHSNYSFSGNSMASKHKKDVAHLNMSEACRAYIACNMELDRALESLLNKLEHAGVLDKTVICMTADHYPYGLTAEQLCELAGKDLDPTVEQYRNGLVLWNSAMEKPVVVDKPCSSIDVVPTLLNLFGVDYDARLLPGKDILSTDEGFVWFVGNNSFISGNMVYNSKNKAVTDLNGKSLSVDNATLTALKKRGSLMMTMNRLLIENDYYNKIRKHLK